MADRLLDVPGAEPVRRELLLDALDYYRQFVAEAHDDPQLRHELALAHFKSGVIAGRLGLAADAIAEYQAAQQLLAELVAVKPTSADFRAQLAVTHNNLALLLAGRGDVDAARKHYTAAITIQQRLADQDPGNPSFASQLAESQANLGMLLDQIGDAAAAEGALRRACDVLRPLAESRPDEPKYARNLAIACNNLSYVLRKRDPMAAETAAREAIAILEPLAANHPGEIQYQDDLALCYNNLAALESQSQRLDEAIEWHHRAIALQERLGAKGAGRGAAPQRSGGQLQQSGRGVLPRQSHRRCGRRVRRGSRAARHAGRRLSERTGVSQLAGGPVEQSGAGAGRCRAA